jgi:hypothetical protein
MMYLSWLCRFFDLLEHFFDLGLNIGVGLTWSDISCRLRIGVSVGCFCRTRSEELRLGCCFPSSGKVYTVGKNHPNKKVRKQPLKKTNYGSEARPTNDVNSPSAFSGRDKDAEILLTIGHEVLVIGFSSWINSMSLLISLKGFPVGFGVNYWNSQSPEQPRMEMYQQKVHRILPLLPMKVVSVSSAVRR